MKKIFLIAVLLYSAQSISAQTFAEWFRQTATQKKYLLQQIAALQVYASYLSKGYAVAKEGLTTIRGIKHGDLNLHSNYFTSLITVYPKIKRYTKVADIISLQISITRQVTKTIKDCRNSHQLTTAELNYLQKVFDALLDDCAKCLDALFSIITDGQVSMKDDERIAAIDKLYDDMAGKQVFARAFSNTSKGLCVQRENDQRDIIISKKLNGLQ
ncbi:MAG: hypothetical protein JST58_03470 [Bacteroidetes bacterium]|nr:hypothetical protein [Bacteroidota bacterium]